MIGPIEPILLRLLYYGYCTRERGENQIRARGGKTLMRKSSRKLMIQYGCNIPSEACPVGGCGHKAMRGPSHRKATKK